MNWVRNLFAPSAPSDANAQAPRRAQLASLDGDAFVLDTDCDAEERRQQEEKRRQDEKTERLRTQLGITPELVEQVSAVTREQRRWIERAELLHANKQRAERERHEAELAQLNAPIRFHKRTTDDVLQGFTGGLMANVREKLQKVDSNSSLASSASGSDAKTPVKEQGGDASADGGAEHDTLAAPAGGSTESTSAATVRRDDARRTSSMTASPAVSQAYASAAAAAASSSAEDTALTPLQYEHAIAMLQQCAPLRDLRYQMCPRYMDEDCFWRVYYELMHEHLRDSGVDLLVARPAVARSVQQPPPEDIGMWDFITASDQAVNALDKLSDARDKVVFDDKLYDTLRWMPADIDSDERLRGLAATYQLGVLMRQGVPPWLEKRHHARAILASVHAELDDGVIFDRFERTQAQVFGPNVPRSCARVPNFDGWFRPDEHTALSDEQVEAATRVLVMLAMEHPDLYHAPPMPDAVLLLLRVCTEAQCYVVAARMLELSGGRNAVLEDRGESGGGGGGGGGDRAGSGVDGGGGGTTAAADGHVEHDSGVTILHDNSKAGRSGAGKRSKSSGKFGRSSSPSVALYVPTQARDDFAAQLTFTELLRRSLPELHEHIRKLRIATSDFVDVWFGRLFVSSLPYVVCCRIFDWYVYDGEAVLHSIGLALLQLHCEELLACGNADLFLNHLQAVGRAVADVERLMRMAMSFVITRSLVGDLHRRLPRKHETAVRGAPVLVGVAGVGGTGQRRRQRRASAAKDDDGKAGLASRLTAFASAAINVGDQLDRKEGGGDALARHFDDCRAQMFYRPRLRQLSRIATEHHFEEIWSWLPSPYRVMDPVLVFSTAEHGCSLRSFYQHCTEEAAPVSLLLVKTKKRKVLGAFVAAPWRLDAQTHAYGSGESFVFRLEPPPARVYRWEPGNDELFQRAHRDFIEVGGGAIWLDNELWAGRSEPSDTFRSPPLLVDEMERRADSAVVDALARDQQRFECVAVELWAFDEPEA